MLAENLTLISLYIQIAGIPKALSFTWDPDSHSLKSIKEQNYLKNIKWKVNLYFIFVIAVVLQVIVFLRDPQNQTNLLVVGTMAGNVSALLIISAVFLNSCKNRGDDLVNYVNGMLTFDELFKTREPTPGKSKKRLLTQLDLATSYAACFSMAVFPILITFGVHWWDPCKPSLLGYWLLAECRNTDSGRGIMTTEGTTWVASNLKDLANFILKLAVFLFNYWMWAVGYMAMVLVIGMIQILGVMSLRDTLDKFVDICILQRQPVTETIQMYRHIQIISILGSSVGSGANMTGFIMAAISTLTGAMVVLIRLPWSVDNILVILTFGVMAVDAMLATVVVLGEIAGIYKDSKELLHQLGSHKFLQGHEIRREREYMRRFRKSCPVLKIVFGDGNFVEEGTPLNCINFANSLIVQLLLLKI